MRQLTWDSIERSDRPGASSTLRVETTLRVQLLVQPRGSGLNIDHVRPRERHGTRVPLTSDASGRDMPAPTDIATPRHQVSRHTVVERNTTGWTPTTPLQRDGPSRTFLQTPCRQPRAAVNEGPPQSRLPRRHSLHTPISLQQTQSQWSAVKEAAGSSVA